MTRRLHPDVNEWITDNFDRHYSSLMGGSRNHTDIAPIFRRIKKRLEHYGVPKDFSEALAVHSLATHYALNIGEEGILGILRKRIEENAYFNSIHCEQNSPEANWCLAQEHLGSSIPLTFPLYIKSPSYHPSFS